MCIACWWNVQTHIYLLIFIHVKIKCAREQLCCCCWLPSSQSTNKVLLYCLRTYIFLCEGYILHTYINHSLFNINQLQIALRSYKYIMSGTICIPLSDYIYEAVLDILWIPHHITYEVCMYCSTIRIHLSCMKYCTYIYSAQSRKCLWCYSDRYVLICIFVASILYLFC